MDYCAFLHHTYNIVFRIHFIGTLSLLVSLYLKVMPVCIISLAYIIPSLVGDLAPHLGQLVVNDVVNNTVDT